jgi:hypothetical protein
MHLTETLRWFWEDDHDLSVFLKIVKSSAKLFHNSRSKSSSGQNFALSRLKKLLRSTKSHNCTNDRGGYRQMVADDQILAVRVAAHFTSASRVAPVSAPEDRIISMYLLAFRHETISQKVTLAARERRNGVRRRFEISVSATRGESRPATPSRCAMISPSHRT